MDDMCCKYPRCICGQRGGKFAFLGLDPERLFEKGFEKLILRALRARKINFSNKFLGALYVAKIIVQDTESFPAIIGTTAANGKN
jgi:hypothetical protein